MYKQHSFHISTDNLCQSNPDLKKVETDTIHVHAKSKGHETQALDFRECV